MLLSKMNHRVKKIFFEKDVMKITWQTGKTSKILFRFLRLHCPCASCVSELSGEKNFR